MTQPSPATAHDRAAYVPPAKYTRSGDNAQCCPHATPVGPGSCEYCWELHEAACEPCWTLRLANAAKPSPADTLRAAADKLRSLATAASPGPWSVNSWDNVETSRYEELAEVWPLQAEPGANVRYIAAMNPGVGAGLAGLLERVASNAIETDHEHHTSPSWCNEDTCDLSAALAVARAILGEDQT